MLCAWNAQVVRNRDARSQDQATVSIPMGLAKRILYDQTSLSCPPLLSRSFSPESHGSFRPRKTDGYDKHALMYRNRVDTFVSILSVIIHYKDHPSIRLVSHEQWTMECLSYGSQTKFNNVAYWKNIRHTIQILGWRMCSETWRPVKILLLTVSAEVFDFFAGPLRKCLVLHIKKEQPQPTLLRGFEKTLQSQLKSAGKVIRNY